MLVDLQAVAQYSLQACLLPTTKLLLVVWNTLKWIGITWIGTDTEITQSCTIVKTLSKSEAPKSEMRELNRECKTLATNFYPIIIGNAILLTIMLSIKVLTNMESFPTPLLSQVDFLVVQCIA